MLHIRHMRSTNNFIEYASKSNTGLFNTINVSIKLWNNLHNQVKSMNCYTSYKTHIKSMLTNMYL